MSRPGQLNERREPESPEALQAAWVGAYAAGARPAPSGWVAPAAAAPGSRSRSDAEAAWRRWHRPDAARGFGPAERPWYAALERARCEILAARQLPGMRHNLAPDAALAPQAPAMASLYLAARHLFDGKPWPRPVLTPAGALKRLARRLAPWRRPPAAELEEPQLRAALGEASALLEAPERFAAALAPLIRALAASDLAEQTPASAAEGTPEGAGDAGDDPDAPPQEAEKAEEADEAAAPAEPAEAERPAGAYSVWSRRLDEEQSAARYLGDEPRLLPPLPPAQRQRLRHLAHRLQRELLAARQRHWRFDQDEGRLDSRRVARLIGPRPSHRIFRQEQEAEVPEACVTLLVDHSASLDAEQRLMAAQAIDFAVATLERCRVRCEVLGYTTRFASAAGGKPGDNPLYSGWQQAGRPAAPGRLNALRHIVYKSAEQPWRRARQSLGLLLDDAFGAENLDGEALAWAANRLLRQPQPRRVLIVLSDGSPFDAATAEANGRAYLEEHLRQVIAAVERSPIQLTAIGAGFDVGRFYSGAITLRHDEPVADTLFAQLGELLRRPDDRLRRHERKRFRR